MPRRAARASPETNAIGVARISGHGVATTRTASAATGEPETTQPSAGDGERDRQEDDRGAVGEARRARAVGLGLLHEVHDARVGRRRRRAQRTTSIASPTTLAPLRISSPGVAAHGQRLAGQGGLVEHRLAARRACSRPGTISPARTQQAVAGRARRPPERRRAARPRAGARRPARAARARSARAGHAGRRARRAARRPRASARRRAPPRARPATSDPVIASSAMTSAPSWPRSMRRTTVERRAER